MASTSKTDGAFRFAAYDHTEVVSAAHEFLGAFRAAADALADAHSTAQWTEVILDWFANTASAFEGVVVDAHRSKRISGELPEELFHDALRKIAKPSDARGRSRECMIDLAHHRFRPYDDYARGVGYWRDAYAGAAEPEMLLALESEAGHAGSPALNSHKVLEDASKLVPLAARVKVVVFGTNHERERSELRKISGLMHAADYTRTRAGGRPLWLWLDLPWARWTPEFGPAGWLGEAGSSDCHPLRAE